MSTEAVEWALELAPVPRGKRLAAFVLLNLAKHAEAGTAVAYPSVGRLAYNAQTDPSNIRQALRELADAGLIAKDGLSEYGSVRWVLNLDRRRPDTFQENLAERRAAAAARQARSRARKVETPDAVTVESTVTSRCSPPPKGHYYEGHYQVEEAPAASVGVAAAEIDLVEAQASKTLKVWIGALKAHGAGTPPEQWKRAMHAQAVQAMRSGISWDQVTREARSDALRRAQGGGRWPKEVRAERGWVAQHLTRSA